MVSLGRLLTLSLVHQALTDIEFILVGWDASMYEIPFRHINPGVVPAAELPDYYRMCDAALVISLTNLSLLPLELSQLERQIALTLEALRNHKECGR